MNDKRFCVYFHKNSNTGEIFYIGKGNAKRPYMTSSRGQAWKDYLTINNCTFEVEIYREGLTSTEALHLEETLIQSGEYPNIINSVLNCKVKDSLVDVVNDVYYDPTSPTFLRWKTDRGNWLYKAHTPAGSKSSFHGYVFVQLNSKIYRVHRIVWALHNGEIPDGYVINHIDSDPSNNAIENLEAVPHKENMRKTKRHSNNYVSSNSCGVTGVRYKKDKDCFEAYWCLKLKQYSKTFSVSKYGDIARQMAIDYRNAMWFVEDDPDKCNMLLSEFNLKYKDLIEKEFPDGISIQKNSSTGTKYFRGYHKDSEGKGRYKGFSINKYGYDEAYRLACEWRKQMEELYYNKPQ